MCTGRYDRFSTSTLEFSTDIAAVAPAGYLRLGPLSIFLSLSAGLRGWSPAEHGPSSGPRLVQPGDPRLVRRIAHAVRVPLRLRRDREHRVDERVERLLALGLGRFDHERALHDQREIDGRRVKSVVEEPLRH